MDELLTLSACATKLGCSPSFLRKKCAQGALPAVMVGNEYRVQWADVLALATARPKKPIDGSPVDKKACGVQNQLDEWLNHLTHVKALSPRTLSLYRVILNKYLKRMAQVEQAPLTIKTLFDRATILAVYAQLPPKSFSTKNNTHIALMSLAKYLVGAGKLEQAAIETLRGVKPCRQVDPKRTHLKPADVSRLFDGVLTREQSPLDNLTVAAAFACMAYAGLRVSEVSALRPQDIDLAGRTLTIRHGKGGKDRKVGITNSLYGYLAHYNRLRPQGDTFFITMAGAPFDKGKLAKRMKLVSERLNIDITCHGLRRTFATLAANQGRSINSIRIALGHSNLETTQSYLRTSEAEVVEQMKDW